MSPPRRRSARIRGGVNGTPFKPTKQTLDAMPAVDEHDETPKRAATSNRDNVANSPAIPGTPATAGRIQPPRYEMHPSLIHQSTKKPDAGMSLGFTDIGAPKPDPLTTPSKITMPANNEFEFRFARPTESLGPEAQQMMADIREEAKRIKAELQAKHQEEKAKNGDGMSSVLDGRRFAQPKGKAGRYSELHMNEFKKMDSIAGHPSAFRSQPGRIPLVNDQAQKSLKRTQSKANLREDEESSSSKPGIKMVSDRRDDASPSKRARQHIDNDAAFARPTSSQSSSRIPSKIAAPSATRSTDAFESFASPTQATLARTSSSKPPLKSILKSPSKATLRGQYNGNDDTSHKSLLRSPSKINMGEQSTNASGAQQKGLLRSPSKVNLEGQSTTSTEGQQKSLLRSPSKANLDGQSTTSTDGQQKSLLRSPSKVNLSAEPAALMETPKKTLMRSPSKPTLGGQSTTSLETPQKSLLRSPSKVNLDGHSGITTPTQASLARSKQIGTPVTTGIPRSPSKMTLSTPSMVKTNDAPIVSTPGTAQRFADKMKSILRRGGSEKKEMAPPQSNIPTMSKSPSRANLNKDLPSVPSTPTGTQIPRSKSTKHVNFTPNTIAKDIADQSPTPLKSGIPRSKSHMNLNAVAYPVLPSPAPKAAERPSVPDFEMSDDKIDESPLPKGPKSLFFDATDRVMTGTEATPAAYPQLPQLRETQANEIKEPAQAAAAPGIFTFQHGTQIKFGTPPRKLGFGVSPGQSSIRKVRESLFPHPPASTMPGSFPGAAGNENKDVPVLSTPHGLSYKKRARADADDEEERERSGGDERSPKKRKQVAAEGQMLVAPKLEAKGGMGKPKSPVKGGAAQRPGAKKTGGLTMSRLRALATPKRRN